MTSAFPARCWHGRRGIGIWNWLGRLPAQRGRAGRGATTEGGKRHVIAVLAVGCLTSINARFRPRRRDSASSHGFDVASVLRLPSVISLRPEFIVWRLVAEPRISCSSHRPTPNSNFLGHLPDAPDVPATTPRVVGKREMWMSRLVSRNARSSAARMPG